jgi:ribosomal protein L7/L12
MNEQSKYGEMVGSGADAGQVYLAAKADGLSSLESIRLIRELFGLSLVEAKEVSVVADELASSLSEYQERFIPALEALIEEEQRESQRSQE